MRADLAEFGDNNLANHSPTREKSGGEPIGRILIPVNGTDVSRRAAEAGFALARTGGSRVSALYVAADDAILKEAERCGYDLFVLGVTRRPGETLFFGNMAAALLERCDTAILFVAS